MRNHERRIAPILSIPFTTRTEAQEAVLSPAEMGIRPGTVVALGDIRWRHGKAYRVEVRDLHLRTGA